MAQLTPEAVWQKLRRGVFVVAEIGKNFIQTKRNQPVSVYLANAKRLVDEAKKAGADAVKFQTHNVEDEQLNIRITSPHFSGAERYSWVLRNTKATPLDKFWKPLKKYCDRTGILFFSTPMSRGAAMILNAVGAKLWKVGSGDILDFVMLDYLARTGKPIIMSSGMSTLAELKKSVDFIRKRSRKIYLLHAVSKYPCPIEDLNLKTIGYLREKFNLPVGFSDHSLGYESAVIAVALGAKIIEKHFSLSRDLWGADHKVSMIPGEFKTMVAEIRKVESDRAHRTKYLNSNIIKKVMGRSGKTLKSGEEVFRPLFRKSIVAAADIGAGTGITADLIYAMRPQKYAGGLPSEKYEEVIGRIASVDLKKFEPIAHEKIR